MGNEEPSGQQAVEHLAELFRDWFKSSGVDFWSEANAPEELAQIAMRFRTAAPTEPSTAYPLAVTSEMLEAAKEGFNDADESGCSLDVCWGAALTAALGAAPGKTRNWAYPVSSRSAGIYDLAKLMGQPITAPSTAAGEMAFVCRCGWEGSYADLNETAEGMSCPKCRLSRNMDCVATPPAQGVEPGVFVVDAAIQDVSDEAVSLTAKRLRESGLPNVAQIMLTLSALLNGARTALATPPTPSASFRDRLEELAQDWSSRKYNYPSDRVSDEEYARNEGKEDAYQDAAIDLCRLLKEPETSPPWQDQAAQIRRDALEEAAKICDEMYVTFSSSMSPDRKNNKSWAMAANALADKIRALVRSEKGEGK